MRPIYYFSIRQRVSKGLKDDARQFKTTPILSTCPRIRGQSRLFSAFKEKDHGPPDGDGTSLRLMPLGGSVTQGVGSSTGAGYRKPLLEMLQNHGFEVQMVGSRKTGSMTNNSHEGWPGFRIDQIGHKARLSTPTLLPHIFTLNAGSNDCLQSFKIDEAGNRLDQLLEFLWKTSPGSTIILSTLIVSADKRTESNVSNMNEQFRLIAEQKANELKRIIFVDMHGKAGPQVDCLVDGVHPDNEGYERMAKLWFNGILEAMQRGLLKNTAPGQ